MQDEDNNKIYRYFFKMTSKMLGMGVLTLAFMYMIFIGTGNIDKWAVALFTVYGTIMILPKSWSDFLKVAVKHMNTDISFKDIYSDTRTKDK